jgi:hypothetical protein
MDDPAARVKDKYLSSFGDAVMTMISVILGLTLYFLALSVQQIAASDDFPKPLLQFMLWKAFFVFLLAVGLFHMYQYTTPILFAAPSYFLGLPVLAIGTSLAIMAASIATDPIEDLHVLFCIALVAFYFFGVIAFGQTRKRAREAPRFTDKIKADACRNLIAFSILAVVSGAYLSVNLNLTRPVHPNDQASFNYTADYVFLFANVLVLAVAVTLTKCKLLIPIHEQLSAAAQRVSAPIECHDRRQDDELGEQ